MQLVEIALFSDDVPALAQFYERLLGSPPAHRGEGIAVFRLGPVQILIHRRYAPGPDELPPENHVAFDVPDLDAAVARLSAAGVTVEHPPRDYDWGRSAYLRDPDGGLIELQAAAGDR